LLVHDVAGEFFRTVVAEARELEADQRRALYG
jgi:hypothetical protein